uniref:hypothetical protein n=1 Tax=Candidatus Electronema sp. TaxID=2698783 RepID=UPI0040566F0E
MPDIGGAEEFKFLEDSEMKTKSKLLTGAVAGLSFLALAATGAFASVANTGDAYCAKGKVVAVGSGYTYPAFSSTIPALTVSTYRTVTLQCDVAPTKDAPNALLGTPAMGIDPRTFLIPVTPDKDGIYAAALTALADDKPVEFVLYSTPGYATTPATTVSGRHTASYYHRGFIKLLNVLEGP